MHPITKTLALVAAGLLTQAAAAEGRFTVKSGIDYTSGDYGTDTTTEITSIPFIGTYDTDLWSLKLTLPYVRITGADNVLAGVGPIRRGNGNGNGGGGGGSTTVRQRSASGMGDVTASATYFLYADPVTRSGVDVTGKIKFGTADETKALGTGENDVWVLVDAYRQFGAVTLLGGIGYGMLGDAPNLPLKNVVSANLGVSYKLSDQASVGTLLDLRTRATDGGDPQRELTAFYTRKLGGGYKMQAYAVAGFADGSPDWGGGFNVGYSY